ncbi:hypothetical protein [Mycoplasma simbae]|uniref:hypothetical protein n=1 Tax=Mycoplasma simbae TaxID=36744 RepID=UPI0004976D77|nr:hypothetical protein [Mycoplasma simbae]
MKKSLKLTLALGSASAFTALPLIASACGHTKEKIDFGKYFDATVADSIKASKQAKDVVATDVTLTLKEGKKYKLSVQKIEVSKNDATAINVGVKVKFGEGKDDCTIITKEIKGFKATSDKDYASLITLSITDELKKSKQASEVQTTDITPSTTEAGLKTAVKSVAVKENEPTTLVVTLTVTEGDKSMDVTKEITGFLALASLSNFSAFTNGQKVTVEGQIISTIKDSTGQAADTYVISTPDGFAAYFIQLEGDNFKSLESDKLVNARNKVRLTVTVVNTPEDGRGLKFIKGDFIKFYDGEQPEVPVETLSSVNVEDAKLYRLVNLSNLKFVSKDEQGLTGVFKLGEDQITITNLPQNEFVTEGKTYSFEHIYLHGKDQDKLFFIFIGGSATDSVASQPQPEAPATPSQPGSEAQPGSSASGSTTTEGQPSATPAAAA